MGIFSKQSNKSNEDLKNHIIRNLSMHIFPFIFLILFSMQTMAQNIDQPLRLGIAGLTHDHVHGILKRPDKGDIKIVGIAEPDKQLAML